VIGRFICVFDDAPPGLRAKIEMLGSASVTRSTPMTLRLSTIPLAS